MARLLPDAVWHFRCGVRTTPDSNAAEQIGKLFHADGNGGVIFRCADRTHHDIVRDHQKGNEKNKREVKMKNILEKPFCEALMYVRKKNKDCSSRSKLAVRTRIESWYIASFERGERLPTRKQLAAICKELNSPQLREVGEKEIEYARTHPDVKICYADNTTCWKCHKPMKTVYGLIDGCPIPPDAFSDGMIKVCADKGVILEERRSGTTGETHLVNVCEHCGAFLGEFYLHDLWYGATETIQVEDVSDFIPDKEEIDEDSKS